MEYKDPGRSIPITYLLYSWGSLFGVPSRVPLVLMFLTTARPTAIDLRSGVKDVWENYIGVSQN